jgi:hypothetical protein
MQVIIDDRADPVQRDALYKIMTGAETEETATILWVYSAMAPNKLEPLFLPIAIDVDVDRRRGRLHVPGILDITAEPIRNPVTGAEHRVRVDLPQGIQFRLGEEASGTTTTIGAFALSGLSGAHSISPAFISATKRRGRLGWAQPWLHPPDETSIDRAIRE